MSASKNFKGLALLMFLYACQGNHKSTAIQPRSESQNFVKSVAHLNPELAENQLLEGNTYNGQIVLIVKSQEVIDELKKIAEINNAIEDITFESARNEFGSIVFTVHLKRNINPFPYYYFFQEYEGVQGAEFDGVIGLADQ